MTTDGVGWSCFGMRICNKFVCIFCRYPALDTGEQHGQRVLGTQTIPPLGNTLPTHVNFVAWTARGQLFAPAWLGGGVLCRPPTASACVRDLLSSFR